MTTPPPLPVITVIKVIRISMVIISNPHSPHRQAAGRDSKGNVNDVAFLRRVRGIP